MKSRFLVLVLLGALVTGLVAGGCSSRSTTAKALRLGYFANLTHAQALLGMADGSFARSVGIPITTRIFDAGPAGITALLAGEIDLLYVGPSPAVNGFTRSAGKALRIVAGAASGGAIFAVRPEVEVAALTGTRLASPGLGNTQDVALRFFLNSKGLPTTDKKGTVRLTPMANADILNLFRQGELDGAWVPEPWGSRLVVEAGARMALDERDLWPNRTFAATVLVVATPYLETQRESVKRFLKAHVEMTVWIHDHPAEASAKLQAELAKLQGRPLANAVLAAAMTRLDFVWDPMEASVREQAKRAFALGLLGTTEPDLKGLFAPDLLKEVGW